MLLRYSLVACVAALTAQFPSLCGAQELVDEPPPLGQLLPPQDAASPKDTETVVRQKGMLPSLGSARSSAGQLVLTAQEKKEVHAYLIYLAERIKLRLKATKVARRKREGVGALHATTEMTLTISPTGKILARAI